MTDARSAREHAEVLLISAPDQRMAREHAETLLISTVAERLAREHAETLLVTYHRWWDGSEYRNADLLGWWDGTAIARADILGWWDGTAIRPVEIPPYLGGSDGIRPTVTIDGLWKCDDTSGTVLTATSGSAGAIVGTPTLGVPPLVADGGFAIQTTGNSPTELTVPVTASGNPFSLWCTWKHTGDNSSNYRVWADHNSSNGIGIVLTSTTIQLQLNQVAAFDTGIASATVRDGNRHQFVLTGDGVVTEFYIDGAWAYGIIRNTTMASFDTPVHFGRFGTGVGDANYFAGIWDQIGYSRTYMSALDVAEMWAATP
jgi:hypothetical protein